MRQGRRQVVRHGIDLSAQCIGDRLARPLVRNVQQLDTSQVHEVLDIGMTERSRARRGKGVLVGVGLGQRDEFLHGLGRHAGVHHKDAGHAHHIGDGSKVLDRVIGQLAEDGRVGAMGGHRGHADGVAVGSGLGDFRSADGAAGSAAVVHHHGLAQYLAHLVGQQTRHHIGGAARTKGHDQADGTIGVVRCGIGRERGGQRGGRCAGGNGRQNGTTNGHAASPWIS